MKRLAVALGLLLGLSAIASAQVPNAPPGPPVQCGNSVVYGASTSGSTQLVAAITGRRIYVCGYTITAGGTVNVKLIGGTGAACVTDSADLTPAYPLIVNGGIVDGAPFFRGLGPVLSAALCINTSGAVAVQAVVYYGQY